VQTATVWKEPVETHAHLAVYYNGKRYLVHIADWLLLLNAAADTRRSPQPAAYDLDQKPDPESDAQAVRRWANERQPALDAALAKGGAR
jgi:hypothetical protein